MNEKQVIRFNSPYVATESITNLQEAFSEGILSGDGPFTSKCSSFIQEKLKVKKCLLTTSCTHALEISALLLDIKPGDEVIVPSFTFVSTVNAFVLRGASPVYVDINRKTLNIDENLIEENISPKTKAIIVVHYAGIACNMDKILNLSSKYKIPIVEDNAHGIFGKYKGKSLGSIGDLSTLSFHETKNFSCGEGGALILNKSRYIQRAEILREKGTNRSRFFRGEVDKYSWVDLGSSYLLSDILAAVLWSQFKDMHIIQSNRKEIWNHYFRSLKGWSEENGSKLPHIPDYSTNPYHMFYIILPSSEDQVNFLTYLKNRNIMAVFHYLPLHLSEYGKKLGGNKFALENTEKISETIVRLPFHVNLSQETQDYIISAILDYKI